jgi:hypothetical protein
MLLFWQDGTEPASRWHEPILAAHDDKTQFGSIEYVCGLCRKSLRRTVVKGWPAHTNVPSDWS